MLDNRFMQQHLHSIKYMKEIITKNLVQAPQIFPLLELVLKPSRWQMDMRQAQGQPRENFVSRNTPRQCHMVSYFSQVKGNRSLSIQLLINPVKSIYCVSILIKHSERKTNFSVIACVFSFNQRQNKTLEKHPFPIRTEMVLASHHTYISLFHWHFRGLKWKIRLQNRLLIKKNCWNFNGEIRTSSFVFIKEKMLFLFP